MTLIVELHRWCWAWCIALATLPFAACRARAQLDNAESEV